MSAYAPTQRRFSRQQSFRGVAKFSDFKTLHAKRFHNAITGNIFLNDLIQLAQSFLAFFHGLSNHSAQRADGIHHGGNQDQRCSCHTPINQEQRDGEKEQAEQLVQPVGEPIGKKITHAFNIVNYRRHYAADGVVLKKSDGLANEFFKNAIAQIRDGGKSDELHKHRAGKFGDAFNQKCEKKRYRKNRSGVVAANAHRKKRIQIDHVLIPRQRDQRQFRAGVRLQNNVKHRPHHQRDHAFHRANHRKKYGGEREKRHVAANRRKQSPNFGWDRQFALVKIPDAESFQRNESQRYEDIYFLSSEWGKPHPYRNRISAHLKLRAASRAEN